MTQVCIVKHTGGHQEEISYTSRFMQTNKATTEVQADGGTNTYTKRYAFCNAFGIMTGDEDTDAQKIYATEEQVVEIKELIANLNYPEESVLKRLKINDFSELEYIRAVNLLTTLHERVDNIKY